MATLADFRNERLKKLARLRELGINPYPAQSHRSVKIGPLLAEFDQRLGSTVTVAGRITAIRSFGKIAFIRLRDDSGEIQIFMQKAAGSETPQGAPADQAATSAATASADTANATNATHATNAAHVAEAAAPGLLDLKLIKLLDTGDFIEATGTVNKTSTGEPSVFADAVRLLVKTLRPLPGRDGFTNKEERYRRRYVDMNVNPEVRERLVRRSRFWQATRDYLNAHGFIEINTPVLETTTGGADANPFVTHLDALDEDFYLRISQELPLKRLLGGGFEKVYDIGPRFRNEGIDDEHLPEHIALESYAAFEDYQAGMDFYEAMIKYVTQATWGTLQFQVGGFEIDLDSAWPRISYADLLREKFGVDVFAPDRAQLEQILRSHGVQLDFASLADARLLDHIWKLIRKESAGPYWLIHEPLALSPLAKTCEDDPRVVQRFHPIIAGTEMGNGYSELNDPLDQLARFQEQQAQRDAGDAEAQMLDQDFVEMLEYGMPPACGWGYSERNFWLLEGVSGREAVPFPLIRQRGE